MSLPDAASDPTVQSASIREVAASLGLTLRAIRFYESKGLIAPARDDHNRFFTMRDVEQLQLIRKLKLFGLSLLEIKQVLASPADGPYGLTPELCQDLIRRLAEQRGRVTAAITELEQLLA